MRVDLHIHTYFSDGTQSPEEVVAVADEQGLAVISVCDHNTIAAYERLRPSCEAAGIKLIQGVEIDVTHGGKTLHLLAYGFDPENKALCGLLAHNRNENELAGDFTIERMAGDFPAVSVEDYAAYELPFGRGGWKNVNYLYDCGLAESVMAAVKFCMGYGGKYGGYKRDFKSVDEACRIVRESGGIPVLAHPGRYWMAEEMRGKLSAMMMYGIGGVECYHPHNTPQVIDICAQLCNDNNLCITGGSDGHGEFFREVNGIICDIGINRVEAADLRLPMLG